MPVIIDCRTCGRKLRIPDELMGQMVKCPTCGQTFRSGGAVPQTQEAMDAPNSTPAPPPPLPRAEEASPPSISVDDEPESAPRRMPAPALPRVPVLDPEQQPSRPGGGFGFVVVGEGKADPPPPGRRPPPPLAERDDRERPSRSSREERQCRYCDEPIARGTNRCTHCGGWVGKDDDLRPWERHASQRRDVEPHRGGLILTLGILGLVLSPACVIAWMFGLAAWIMGKRDLSRINAGEMDYAGYGTTQAGFICGIIATILCGIPTLCLLGLFLLALMSR